MPQNMYYWITQITSIQRLTKTELWDHYIQKFLSFFTVKPGIAKFQFNAKSFVSIDVKENRFRVRIFRNTGKAYIMGEEFDYTMENTLQFEKDKLSAGKLKYEKSIIVSWNENIKTILNAFSVLIKDGVRNADDFWKHTEIIVGSIKIPLYKH